MYNGKETGADPGDSASSATLPADGTYEADPYRSHLSFRAKAFGSLWVRGWMPAVSGTLRLEDGRLHGVGEVAADKVTTGLRARDWHLRSSHYLHTSQHPVIRMSIDAAPVGSHTARCEVAVRDTPAPVTFELDQLEHQTGALHLRAHSVLDRTLYPMLPPIAGVSRLVHLSLEVIATLTTSPSAQGQAML